MSLTMIVSIFNAVIAIFSSLFMYLSTAELVPCVPHKEDFELVWADEFDADSIDTSIWIPHSFKTNETVTRKGGYWNMNQVSVKDGNLHISTDYYPEGIDDNSLPGWYSCGINTRYSFTQTYGYFEVKCILPKGSGMWSAFWMTCSGVNNVDGSGTDGAEIDILESAYSFETDEEKRNRITSNIHYDGYGEDHQMFNVCTPLIHGDPYEQYNTYGVEWNEDEYIFYINGIESGRTDFGGASQVPEYLVLSVEVGGENGTPAKSWAGPSVETSGEITDFIVDYVRVYQYKQ